MSGPVSPSKVASHVRRRFRDDFGEEPQLVCFAPGRLNLIGAHLDYSGGDVLPIALDLGVYAAGRVRDDDTIRLRSIDRTEAIDVDAAVIGTRGDPAHGWASYPLGVWREFAALTGIRRGVDLVFGGDLPMASGLSSSAAIEVATATALSLLHEREIAPAELALVAHRAETAYVGLQCGIMDQFASALGRNGHALLLHCKDQRFEHVPMDPTRFELLVLDTRKPRHLAATEFNVRVAQCAQAFAVLTKALGARPCLASFTPDDLGAAAELLDPVLFKRVRHVVTEMRRVATAVASLRKGDVETLGELVSASHASARDDYEVSCAELDAITSAACAHPRVYGARLTGAGFGGCGYALVAPGAADDVAAAVRADFVARFRVEPGFAVLHPGGGPRRID